MNQENRSVGNAAAPGSYTIGRIGMMAATAAIAAGIGFALGFPMAALGAIAGLPVGIINYALMYSAVKRTAATGEKGIGTGVLNRSFLRMVISMVALLLAARLGPEFLIGVLIGLIAEMVTYIGDVARFLFNRR